MKTLATAAASIALLAALGAAMPASAQAQQEVRIRYAAARVVVIVENRSDIAVEIESGTSGLPRPTVSRVGDEVRINGNLGRNAFRRCESGPSSARQPGEGASVEVRGHGRVNLSVAPLIVVRSPAEVAINILDGAAVFGSIGRGATSAELGNSGCGDWIIANVDGELKASLAGSGSVRAGTSSSVSASVAGSGSISVGATRELEVSIVGSGDVSAVRVDGSVDVAIAGSGSLTVQTGDVGAVDASIMGSGNVIIEGSADSIEASIMGSGDVRVAAVSGATAVSSMGSGRVRIGS